jgi:uncharacterized cupin superfamily protein
MEDEESKARKLRMKRDECLKNKYVQLVDQRPGERETYYHALLSEEFFITERTVYAILSGEYERTLNAKKNLIDPNQLSIFNTSNEG